jgi:hypothetical protein
MPQGNERSADAALTKENRRGSGGAFRRRAGSTGREKRTNVRRVNRATGAAPRHSKK